MRKIILLSAIALLMTGACKSPETSEESSVSLEADQLELPYLQIVRKFEVPPEKVFDAFTEPEAMRVWWTEQTSFDIDLRVGGSWKIIRKEGGEVYTALGEYLEVKKPHRLVYSYAMPQFSSNVDTIFIDIASTGTSSSVLTFKQKGEDINTELQDLPAEGLSMSEVGWRKGFDLMAKAWEK